VSSSLYLFHLSGSHQYPSSNENSPLTLYLEQKRLKIWQKTNKQKTHIFWGEGVIKWIWEILFHVFLIVAIARHFEGPWQSPHLCFFFSFCNLCKPPVSYCPDVRRVRTGPYRSRTKSVASTPSLPCSLTAYTDNGRVYMLFGITGLLAEKTQSRFSHPATLTRPESRLYNYIYLERCFCF
jgi:hypothetical protein